MLNLSSLDEVRGNNVTLYAIKTLLERKAFPRLCILSGMMGVGKTSVANIIASSLDASGAPSKVYNLGMPTDLKILQEEVFSFTPAKPRAFIFEELQGLSKADQNALLQMFDRQSQNIYIICTTTEIYKIIKTIKSRARVWEFRSLSEKQMAHLLDDYLEDKGVNLTASAKNSLLRASKGVPRDLLKNADMAIDGSFTDSDLDALLGNVADPTMYTLLCALVGETADFVMLSEELFNNDIPTVLSNLRDFWLRYLMERSGMEKVTFSAEMITVLDAIFPEAERLKVAQLLLRSKPDTLLMELLSYNMGRLMSNESTILGQQRSMSFQQESTVRRERMSSKPATPAGGKLDAETLKTFNLNTD